LKSLSCSSRWGRTLSPSLESTSLTQSTWGPATSPHWEALIHSPSLFSFWSAVRSVLVPLCFSVYVFLSFSPFWLPSTPKLRERRVLYPIERQLMTRLRFKLPTQAFAAVMVLQVSSAALTALSTLFPQLNSTLNDSRKRAD
jgi:hypothetical protein